MRILFLNQFYYPDESSASQRVTDLTLDLANTGHDISVVTSSATLAGANRRVKTSDLWRGIRMHRVFCGRYDRGSRLRKSVSDIRFLAGALLRLLLVRRPPDLVVVMMMTPAIGALAVLGRCLRKIRFVCWVQNIAPAPAHAPDSQAIHRLFSSFTKWLTARMYADAELLIVPGSCMARRLQAEGVPSAKIRVVHDWVDGRLILPAPRGQNSFLLKQDLKDEFLLVCAGPLGPRNDVETLVEAMRMLQHVAHIRFAFIGTSEQYPALQALCLHNELKNVRFVAPQPRNELAYLLSAAHAGLVTLRPEFAGTAVASGVYRFMASGRPFIYVGPSETTIAEIARQHRCGWQVPAGDATSLANLILQLYHTPQLVSAAGVRARQAFETHFDRPLAFRAFEELLQSVAQSPKPRRRSTSAIESSGRSV